MVAYSLLGSLLATGITLLQQPCFASAEAIPALPGPGLADFRRALPNSPSGGYAPKAVTCPQDRPTIRSALDGLSDQETKWLELRRKATVEPMVDLLKRANIADFDAAAYVNNAATNDLSALPNIAIAVSGGGYRALMNGAGFVAAADSRTTGATKTGGIGGLLQASTYLAGLSGGGWLVGSIFANNFSSVETLRDGSPGSNVWGFENSIFKGPDERGISILNTASYWNDIGNAVGSKADAGFETSITDYWGRALSYQLVNATDGGPAFTFSSIAKTDNFIQGQTPFPILVADGRSPGTKIISLNATVYEFGPFEMGSFDPTTFGFVPTKYIASNFSNGVVPKDGTCIEGFDQIGFVMGTSSSLFNQFLLQNISQFENKVPSFVLNVVEDILTELGNDNNDIAQYIANPFMGWNPATNPTADSVGLDLVDGGEDLQNIPLTPLIQPVRAVDIIFAVDSSADTNFNWPNGTAMRASYDRTFGNIANGTLFPPVPDANTFINLRLNQRPTFFGCDVANFSLSGDQIAPPLIVYVPNAPYTAQSNVSTLDPQYSNAQRNDIIRNGFDSATQGNGTIDAKWPTCVACAILSRSLSKTKTAVPAACSDCFARYCWNGTIDARDNGIYEPGFIIGNQTTSEIGSGADRGVVRDGGLTVAVVAGIVVALLL
ncbi:lysophospholipase catalytic domain-containing protein [Apodospora peruviana]|uniref:Lysophospholipase n=1 Tax=Apodospora peruviana TaxID=516989 RepID=A0AAE0MFA1_9PEZI|nr:lysophospholipase catalytic domain-containing protein [Apodospora peruviana]